MLVADVFGGSRPKDASRPATSRRRLRATIAAMRARIDGAVGALKAQPAGAAAGRTSWVRSGFCFGGSTVLELAREGAGLVGG